MGSPFEFFGQTRMDRGGDLSSLPGGLARWLVPFTPCRPPWMVKWPVTDVSQGGAAPLSLFTCDMNRLQDPVAGLTDLTRPGVVQANQDATVVSTDAGRRSWGGRIRTAGVGLRTIAFSPLYRGPARITEIAYNAVVNLSGANTGGYMFGVVPNKPANIVKQPRTSTPLPAGSITVFDPTTITDNEGPVDPLNTLYQPEGGANNNNGPLHAFVNMLVPWSAFSIWALQDTASASADGLDWTITFEPSEVTVGGGSVSRGANQYQQNWYLGGGPY